MQINISASKMHFTPWLRLLSVQCGGSVVIVDSLFNVAPIVCGGSVFGPCFVVQYIVSFLVLQSS